MKMTIDEREFYLSEVHIGVLSVPRQGRGPLSAPIWYDYSLGGDVVMFIDKHSVKSGYLKQIERISLCVQNEDPPYVYVSVEGPFQLSEADKARHLTIAVRYLGERRGNEWMEKFG